MMTKEKHLEFVTAFWDGRLERRELNTWVKARFTPGVNSDVNNYRIKPVPKYRPWTGEEGVGKVVRGKTTGGAYIITGYSNKYDCFKVCESNHTPDSLMENFEQLNGEPCGVEEV